jgi:hypothetical protein
LLIDLSVVLGGGRGALAPLVPRQVAPSLALARVVGDRDPSARARAAQMRQIRARFRAVAGAFFLQFSAQEMRALFGFVFAILAATQEHSSSKPQINNIHA